MRLGEQVKGEPLCWHVTEIGALSSMWIYPQFFSWWVLVGDVGEEKRCDEKTFLNKRTRQQVFKNQILDRSSAI